MKKLWLFLLFCWFTSFTQFDKDAYQGAIVAYQAAYIDSGGIVDQRMGNVNMIPASITKLISSNYALSRLGPEFKYETVLSTNGVLENDTLKGDLIIDTDGDPTLNSKYFPKNENSVENWVALLVEKGVKVILGDILFVGQEPLQELVPSGWLWGDIGNYYGAAPRGVNYKDNMMVVYSKGGSPLRIDSISSWIDTLSFDNYLSSNPKGRSDNSYFFSAPNANYVIATGDLPENYSKRVKISMPNPQEILSIEFKGLLVNSGVTVLNGKGTWENNQVIGRFNSPSLLEIVTLANQKSINLFAEAVYQRANGRESLTTDAYANAISNYYDSLGIHFYRLADGSGLSPKNTYAPSSYVRFLAHAYQMDSTTHFLSSLSANGGKGTLKSIEKESLPKGVITGKSGSMAGVKCYAGYVTSKSGRVIAFCIMVNHFNQAPSQVKRDITQWLVKLYAKY